jgi:hypothetical protein
VCLLSVEGGPHEPRVLVEELELDRDEVESDRAERFLRACGVEHGELAELIRSARAVVGSAGTVLMQLHIAEGPPEVTLLADNVTPLHGPPAMRRAAPGVWP